MDRPALNKPATDAEVVLAKLYYINHACAKNNMKSDYDTWADVYDKVCCGTFCLSITFML